MNGSEGEERGPSGRREESVGPEVRVGEGEHPLASSRAPVGQGNAFEDAGTLRWLENLGDALRGRV